MTTISKTFLVVALFLLGVLIWNFVTNFQPRRSETPAPAPVSGRAPS